MLPNLKLLLFCGEILTNRTAEKLREAFPESIVVNTYRLTESTVCITEVVVDDIVLNTYSPLPVDSTRPGTWLYIIDENGKELPEGEQGEIVIVGDTVSTGYYKNPEQTQKCSGSELSKEKNKVCQSDKIWALKNKIHARGERVNILYLEHYAGSPEMGMEFRPYYLSREWVKMGHKVTIIAGDYSHLRNKNPSVDKDWQTETIDEIEYVWLKTGKYDGNGTARALSMERFVRKLWAHSSMIAKKWKPDVVIASSTYPLDTYPSRSIAKKANAKYVHEVHDMWPATLYEVGGLSKRHPFVVAMQIAENSAYKHCDKCIALAPYSKDYMVKHGLNPEKWINIQNGVAEEEWENPEPLPEEHNKFFKENKGKFIVGYFGGHALSNALDKSLDVAKEMKEKGNNDIIFVFVGDGIEKKKLIERAEKESINNAFFLPPVSKKSVPNLIKHFSCSYMTGIPSPLYRFGLCLNKMYDSMMAGIPIICAFDAPDTLVRIYECGYQCDPSNVTEVVKTIEKLKGLSLEQQRQLGINGRNAVINNFTYSKLANEFINNI